MTGVMTTRPEAGIGRTGAVERLLLSPEEAAEMLGVTRSTVYDLLRMRLLTSVKIGRRRLVPVAACREMVDRIIAGSG